MNRSQQSAFECASTFTTCEPPPPARLTPKELETLHWAMLGKTAWEISRIQGRSVATINFHLGNIRRKLGVNTMCGVLRKALEQHIVVLP